jgi:hypothetical protein
MGDQSKPTLKIFRQGASGLFLIVIGAAIAILISIKRIADRVSLMRERKWEERIETVSKYRHQIWSQHLKRAKTREPKQASQTQ